MQMRTRYDSEEESFQGNFQKQQHKQPHMHRGPHASFVYYSYLPGNLRFLICTIPYHRHDRVQSACTSKSAARTRLPPLSPGLLWGSKHHTEGDRTTPVENVLVSTYVNDACRREIRLYTFSDIELLPCHTVESL